MFRHVRRTLIVALSFALITLAVIAPTSSSAAPVTADEVAMSAAPAAAAAPDFLFSVSWSAPTYSGYLVRGGDSWVRYALQIYGWAWYTNHLRVVSFQGWTGTVNLEVLNLPAGVISEIPTSVFVPKSGSATVPIRFLAPANTPLTTATVTLRGTSGTNVKTANVAFTIVDQLPPLP
jgi:hypothetical protein